MNIILLGISIILGIIVVILITAMVSDLLFNK
jgi:hypothetical protein